MIVLSGFLSVSLIAGGMLALGMKSLHWLYNHNKPSVVNWLEQLLFNFSGTCVHLYVKAAQWIGSIAVFLLTVGVLGRLILFTVTHWREIWGP